jgi:hypothetical protein
MTTPLDLILLPLNRVDGQDQPELPGLYAAKPPRRTSRGRALDRLIIHLALDGTAPLSPKGYSKLVGHLANTYYQTSGSSTAAMRTVMEWLNEYLLERNMRGASRGMQSVGLATLAVVRGNRLYLAQSGSTHTYLISAGGLHHFHDPDIAGRGLGMSRATTIQYHQVEIKPQDAVLISAQPPVSWTSAYLGELHGLSLMKMHLRLIQTGNAEMKAGVIQVAEGEGKLRVLRPEPVTARPRPNPSGSPAKKEKTRPQKIKASKVLAPQPPVAAELDKEISTPIVDSTPSVEMSAPPRSAPNKENIPKPKIKKSPRERIIGPVLLRVLKAFGETWQHAVKSGQEFSKRLLPDESILAIPTKWMVFMAIAVPLVVVTISAAVYSKRGEGRMFQEYYLQASYAAEQALQLEDPAQLRAGWKTVLGFLDQAEAYQESDDSQAMRNYALAVLDQLDGVQRLNFQPVLLENLPSDVIINRIVAAKADNELYLLNETNGHVLHATRTDRGYALDNEFVCQPVQKPWIVGPIMDIVALPIDDPNNADVMGIDANGNLLQCIPGNPEALAFQMPPPDMNWGAPSALVLDSGNLFILDPMTNAVWVFWENDGLSELPTLFFDEDVPPMGDVIDITVNRDELYLLHQNGHLTTCTYGYPTRCTDPAEYKRQQNGVTEAMQIFDDAKFNEIQFASPPDASLFLLESESRSIYHFSMRLTYQKQFRPQDSLPPGQITAFSVSPNHQIFIALGNQIYLTPLP